MNDDNWEIINGAVAHRIEALNATNQINLIETVVLFCLNGGPRSYPNDVALRELHRTGTLFLLHSPGQYRDCPVNVVQSETGVVVHKPPDFLEVKAHMDDFFSELDRRWGTEDALDIASFALWKINWIHPFKNGNGRTARAFAYACLSAKIGAILPGAPTVIDQIMTSRDEYERCIREGDTSLVAGNLNLSSMKCYLDRLLQTQIRSAMTQDFQP